MQTINNNTYKNKWIILFAVVMVTFMCCIDSSIVNVALPVMAKKLSATMSSIEWVIVSYVLVICAAILIFGRLGDIKGKTKIFKFGTIIFTLGSFLCGFSTNLTLLIASRIIQGIGAAAAMANNQGIITHVFPSKERGKALGILASVVALGTMVGPPIGGVMVAFLSWNYIFLVNVPIGIFVFILGLKVLPQGANIDEKLDVKGAILFAITVIFLFGSIIGEQNMGYNNPIIIISFILSIICLAIFIKLENKIELPLLHLEIFKNQLFSLSLFCSFISFACLSASVIIVPFYLQDALKISSSMAGLCMMISPLVVAVISPLSGTLSDKIGSELLTFMGLIVTCIGLLLMSILNEQSSLTSVIIFLVVMAVGNGLFQPSNNSLIMSTVPRNKLGIAGSVNSLVRNLAQIFGVALSTTLLYSCMSYKLGYHVADYVNGKDDVFIYGMRYVYLTLVIICAIGALFTAIRLYRTWKQNACIEEH